MPWTLLTCTLLWWGTRASKHETCLSHTVNIFSSPVWTLKSGVKFSTCGVMSVLKCFCLRFLASNWGGLTGSTTNSWWVTTTTWESLITAHRLFHCLLCPLIPRNYLLRHYLSSVQMNLHCFLCLFFSFHSFFFFFWRQGLIVFCFLYNDFSFSYMCLCRCVHLSAGARSRRQPCWSDTQATSCRYGVGNPTPEVLGKSTIPEPTSFS